MRSMGCVRAADCSSCATSARCCKSASPRSNVTLSGMKEYWPNPGPTFTSHDHILELPWIGRVERFIEQPVAIEQRIPIAVRAGHRPEIRHADLEVAAEIHFVGLRDASARVLHRPHHARQHRDADL